MQIKKSEVDFQEGRTVIEVTIEVQGPGLYKIRGAVNDVTHTYFSVEKVDDGPS